MFEVLPFAFCLLQSPFSYCKKMMLGIKLYCERKNAPQEQNEETSFNIYPVSFYIADV